MIILHFAIQSIQGYVIYEQYKTTYQDIALSASFIPWHYTVVGKNNNTVDIISDSLLTEAGMVERLQSSSNADLSELFSKNPRAKTLYKWAPFVVIVNDEKKIGIYDPRFYRNGASFLSEYIDKAPNK
ncbi:hypothetical protein [Shimazuella kribbensis]|uniref:hypothetical protein n=1 Tax=Shimazuella kribbensis TaxID=139808 RepID=UPI0004278F62